MREKRKRNMQPNQNAVSMFKFQSVSTFSSTLFLLFGYQFSHPVTNFSCLIINFWCLIIIIKWWTCICWPVFSHFQCCIIINSSFFLVIVIIMYKSQPKSEFRKLWINWKLLINVYKCFCCSLEPRR